MLMPLHFRVPLIIDIISSAHFFSPLIFSDFFSSSARLFSTISDFRRRHALVSLRDGCYMLLSAATDAATLRQRVARRAAAAFAAIDAEAPLLIAALDFAIRHFCRCR